MNALGGADDEVNRRSNQATEEVVKVSDKDQPAQKKPRFIWTREVHHCFLDAIKQLGFKRAVPTKILELMNVEDLTREKVASHLQKYRLQIKKRDEEPAQARAASENVPKAVYPHMSGIPQQPWVLPNTTQMKKRDEERAQARAASENVPKAVYPHMSGIPQQRWVLPNTMQGINMDCACLDGSQLAPSFTNHNLNMIQGFPTVQEVYGTSRLVHGLYDSNGPHDINKIGYNYGQLPPKPLFDSYPHNLMDRHDTTLVPHYDPYDELSLQGIISPSFVPLDDPADELSLQGIISPSFVPQYDRHDELFVADQGIISPLLAQNMEGLGVGVPRPLEAIGDLTGMKLEGLGLGMPRLPEATGIKVEGHGVGVPRLPTGGLVGTNVKGLGLGVPRLPEATGVLAGMKVEGLGGGVTHLPEATGGPGLGVPRLPESSGRLAGMNDIQKGFSFHEEPESSLHFSDFRIDMKWDVEGNSFDNFSRSI